MRIILFGVVSLLIMTSLHAQIPGVKKEGILSAANPGKLLSQLTNAIKPSSFTDAWSGEKTGFLGKAQKISDAVSMAKTISSLAGFIKPVLFKDGVSAGSLLQTADKVKTMTDAVGLLKGFEGGLKPEALSGSWGGQRSGWLAALDLLK